MTHTEAIHHIDDALEILGELHSKSPSNLFTTYAIRGALGELHSARAGFVVLSEQEGK